MAMGDLWLGKYGNGVHHVCPTSYTDDNDNEVWMYKAGDEYLIISAGENAEELLISGENMGTVEVAFTDNLNGDARDRLFTTYETTEGIIITVHRGPNWPNN